VGLVIDHQCHHLPHNSLAEIASQMPMEYRNQQLAAISQADTANQGA